MADGTSNMNAVKSRTVQSLRILALFMAFFALCSCAPSIADVAEEPNETQQGDALSSAPAATGCGYAISSGLYPTHRGSYGGWVRLTNLHGERGKNFRVLLDVGDTRITDVDGAQATRVEDGYIATAPARLRRHPISRGESYRFEFALRGRTHAPKAYLLALNGAPCDQTAPALELDANRELFTRAGMLVLTAVAKDNASVRKVVFEQDGVVIGERSRAPYTLTVRVSAAQNGRRRYTATAVDASGNQSSDEVRVLVAIGTRFVGTAVARDSDYTNFPAEFTQITPENAGKWASVEATRDEMNWAELDRAYEFAKSRGFVFKLHTLVWGQQQPSWLAGLSVEEQLEELDEWMQLLAERYPDTELVDVVNEPLNAPPSYKDALGGDGATGWDWVIEAFEMARRHFPNAELILNEYPLLMLDEFADRFVEIATLLHERDLIDGIGEQGHYLERTELSVIESNLAKLAATGLPIYISELDVNIANDAHHANRLRDLVRILWAEPAVLGITLWGYVEGNTWRPNAFLVRSDGTRRPAFDWLSCSLARRRGCTVPEYVPQARVGTERAINVEAEEYDAAQGVAALGGVIAYNEDGDWVGYGPIVFQDSWEAFSLTYSKGNEAAGSVSVHLDSIDSAPLLTIDVTPTGDWGSSATIEVPWAAITGEHTVYLRFHGGEDGVANIDRIRFGIPTPTGPRSNLISNADFEEGTSGWFGWGGTLGASTARAHTGAQSLAVTGRSDGAGTAAYNVTSGVSPLGTYPVSFFVTIAGAPEAPVNLTAKVACEGQSDSYNGVASATAVTEGEWLELTGTLNLPDCTLTEVLVYVEGPPAGVDLYVDDASVLAPVPESP